MASTLLTLLLVVSVAIMLVGASPSKKETGGKKPAPTPASKASKCNQNCGPDYNPICAGDGTNKPLSFGNTCVLEKHNCEHNTQLKKQKDGECPNGGGIRLA